jgi:hypothetical protein
MSIRGSRLEIKERPLRASCLSNYAQNNTEARIGGDQLIPVDSDPTTRILAGMFLQPPVLPVVGWPWLCPVHGCHWWGEYTGVVFDPGGIGPLTLQFLQEHASACYVPSSQQLAEACEILVRLMLLIRGLNGCHLSCLLFLFGFGSDTERKSLLVVSYPFLPVSYGDDTSGPWWRQPTGGN